jgi:hypothetical protein
MLKGHKIYQMAVNRQNVDKIPIPTSFIAMPSKIHTNWDFGLKTNYLATLIYRLR